MVVISGWALGAWGGLRFGAVFGLNGSRALGDLGFSRFKLSRRGSAKLPKYFMLL